MNASLGRIKAHLAESAVDRVSKLVQLINDNINPPGPVGEGDVHIRAMYIVSDEVNSFGGRFPSDELGHLTGLLVDSPVMVGHRKDKLPVARTFHAEVVNRDGKSWVKSYFYWLRSSRGAEDLMQNIDAGIYKECSIGFTYLFPECSICGRDIRTCRHEPFEQYQIGSNKQSCHFNYRQVERVLETSLVYRGAVADTAMSKELVAHKAPSARETRITSPAELPLDAKLLVVPFYDSIPVLVSCEDGVLSLRGLEGGEISSEATRSLGRLGNAGFEDVYGQLIGYRGKERCPVDQLERHLSGRNSSVTRLELKLIPNQEVNLDTPVIKDDNRALNIIRHKFCTPSDLNEISSKLKTKHGVRLWEFDKLPPDHAGYVYVPDSKPVSEAGYYRFCLRSGAGDVVLELCRGDQVESYRLKQFHMPRFTKGSRFIADKIIDTTHLSAGRFDRIICGEIESVDAGDEAMVLNLGGTLSGQLFIQTIELHGNERFLVYYRSDSSPSREISQ